MDFRPEPRVAELVNAVLRFIDREIVALENEHRHLLEDERRKYGPDGLLVPEVRELRARARQRSAELGFWTLFGSEELGGSGEGPLTAVHIYEAIAHRYGPERLLISDVFPSPFTNGLTPVLMGMRPQIRDRYLADIAAARRTLCFALSEPDAGSDVWSMRTRAEFRNGAWVLNGVKQWITNAPYADYAMVFAVTDPERVRARRGGVTCFLVHADQPGYDPFHPVPLMGHLGGEQGTIYLTDVKVPEERIIGDLHDGLRLALSGIALGRLAVAAHSVGLARWALERSLEYALQRRVEGSPIAEKQAIRFMLADSAVDIYAARNMVLHAAWALEQHAMGPAPRRFLSMVKLFSTEMLLRVMNRAIQIHGAIGLANATRLEAAFRRARMLLIPDGTSEIQRDAVAAALLKGDVTFE